MPKKSLVLLTESMFYVLMALSAGPMCGKDAADYIARRTGGRLRIGPATLYTILGKFESQKYIKEVQVQGRQRTYSITEAGRQAYDQELARLEACVTDARAAAEEGADHE